MAEAGEARDRLRLKFPHEPFGPHGVNVDDHGNVRIVLAPREATALAKRLTEGGEARAKVAAVVEAWRALSAYNRTVVDDEFSDLADAIRALDGPPTGSGQDHG